MTKLNHQIWMAKAIRLAKKGLYTTRSNPRVGCVIVKDKKLIASGFHTYQGQAHAEINALNQLDKIEDAENSTFYVTLEPCAHHGKTPPCVEAVIKVKPKCVVIAMQDPNPLVSGKSIELFKQHNIEVIVGILEAEAFELNKGFIKRMSCGFPFIRLKMAMSFDAKTALKNGKSEWITSTNARNDVQYLRARSCAVLSSISTILADDPSLNVRLSSKQLNLEQDIQQPIRVILDSQLKISPKAHLFSLPGEIWLLTLSDDIEKIKQFYSDSCQVISMQSKDSQLDLIQVMTLLASKGINEIHTECGATLSGALLKHQLVDEMVVYMAPKLLGGEARSLLEWGELTQMDETLDLKISKVTSIGEDFKFQIKPLYS